MVIITNSNNLRMLVMTVVSFEESILKNGSDLIVIYI